MSFGVPSDAGMEGPQRRRHDRAQRRKILIMGPSAARYRGPSAAVGPQRSLGLCLRGYGAQQPARAWRACAEMVLKLVHGPLPCQQAYKQTVPANIQANRASKHTS